MLQGSPRWDNNFCKADTRETAAKSFVAHRVPIPVSDPVYGLDGPLVDIWNKAATSTLTPGAVETQVQA